LYSVQKDALRRKAVQAITGALGVALLERQLNNFFIAHDTCIIHHVLRNCLVV